MDGATLSPYPHYSWLAHWIAIQPPKFFELREDRHVTHRLVLTISGNASTAWTSRGSEVLFQSTAGDMGFFPCDEAVHGLAITTTEGYRAYTMLLPKLHLSAICESDGLDPGRGLFAIPVFRDALMHASLLRLSEGSGRRDISENIGDEIAARQIVMRLCAISGGKSPDWQKDTSIFSPGVMREIVARVDSQLSSPHSLGQVSSGFGLSPAHFARKFRRSTGLSLNRFMNRRRIGLALVLLRTADWSLAKLSLELGFCTQSHFTRLFSALTGLTPYRFGRAQRLMAE
jgi:AraC-like DNA-binding protein